MVGGEHSHQKFCNKEEWCANGEEKFRNRRKKMVECNRGQRRRGLQGRVRREWSAIGGGDTMGKKSKHVCYLGYNRKDDMSQFWSVSERSCWPKGVGWWLKWGGGGGAPEAGGPVAQGWTLQP